jgi:hypothetical protein
MYAPSISIFHYAVIVSRPQARFRTPFNTTTVQLNLSIRSQYRIAVYLLPLDADHSPFSNVVTNSCHATVHLHQPHAFSDSHSGMTDGCEHFAEDTEAHDGYFSLNVIVTD